MFCKFKIINSNCPLSFKLYKRGGVASILNNPKNTASDKHKQKTPHKKTYGVRLKEEQI